MEKYLYGASVQGIQSFIFETNKLKEIVGASQLIDNINEIEFKKFCEKKGHTFNNNNEIINTAGNIKYIFDDKTELEKVVREFPKYISNYAPGITISQAVVELDKTKKLDKIIDELERKLKIQRNKAQMPADIGFMGLERARRTGKVGFYELKNKEGKIEEIQDRGTFLKIPLKANQEKDKWLKENKKLTEQDTLALFEKFRKEGVTVEEVPFDIEKITGKAEHSWLAIIHADGNGLGNILQNLSEKIEIEEEKKVVFSIFSKQLKAATEAAAQKAFTKIIEDKKDEVYPFRPVVLGGDDLTVIIRADLAFKFTIEFLNAFEIETKNHFKELNKYGVDKLTACAGIAYIKDSYPFHYGVHLAESLVKKSKKLSKSINPNLAPSSLAFYKVQSSFTEDLEKMIERTQFINEENKDKAGVYFIKDEKDYHDINELNNLLKELQEFATDKSKGISKLRQWISELYKDKSKADFMMDRIKSVNNDFYKKLELSKYRNQPSVLNDLIQLHTFNLMYKNDNNEN